MNLQKMACCRSMYAGPWKDKNPPPSKGFDWGLTFPQRLLRQASHTFWDKRRPSVSTNYAKVFDGAHYEVHKGYTRAQLIQAFRLDNANSVTQTDDQVVSQIAAADPELITNITEPSAEEKVLPIPDLGEAYFPRDVP